MGKQSAARKRTVVVDVVDALGEVLEALVNAGASDDVVGDDHNLAHRMEREGDRVRLDQVRRRLRPKLAPHRIAAPAVSR